MPWPLQWMHAIRILVPRATHLHNLYLGNMQPRTSAEVIPNDLRLRLSTHSLLDNDPSLARQTALREAARVALVRLKYSMSLRRAEFSRARRAVPWDSFKMGDIVYFYRQQQVAPGGGARGTKRKRLILNQWHGPGMITALEGGRQQLHMSRIEAI